MSELKKCKLTGKEFIVRDEDLEFLKKISPTFKGKFFQIPSPTLCSEERTRKRLTYRNERILYKRKSSLSNQDIVSFYHPDSPLRIYSHDEWWSDKWDAMIFGKNYDFNRGFFEQFYELQLQVPRPPLVNNKAENSPYCNFADGNKNSYLLTSSNWNEDSFYGFLVVKNKDAVDCLWCTDCELVYQCTDCIKCYNLKYGENCDNCSDSAFLYNCTGLHNCLFCINLKNKEYHILNKPVSKEEYENALAFLNGSYKNYQITIEKFNEYKEQFPIRQANNYVSCENVFGENIFNSKNIYLSFDVYNSEDCAYSHDGLNGKDCYDICYFDGVELCYESTSLIGYGYRFTNFCRDSYNLYYCDNCHGCKNCFGCNGLRHKENCVFNKQYSKDEYEDLVARIITKMIEIGEWGEFFPAKYSPFAYNETLALDYFPITEKEAIKNSYAWIKPDQKEYQPQKYVIPDNILDTDEKICNEILTCEITGKNYKIIPQELKFYKKMNLPTPHRCPDQRTFERIARRNPRQLFDRVCGKCGTAIKTTFSPNRKEVIYCEQCYLKEIG